MLWLFPRGLQASAPFRWASGDNDRFSGPLLAVVAVIFSGSRSALVACIAALIVLVALAANRGMFVWGGLAVLTGTITAIADPSLITSLFSAGKADPSSVRSERLGPLFDLAVHHPFTGLGLSGLDRYFVIHGVDNAYAVIYATLGVIGILAWLSLIVMIGVTAGLTLQARRGSFERLIGAACLAGAVAAAVAAATYDFTNTAQSTWTLIMLGAVGVAATEAAGRRVTLHWSAPRLLLPAIGTFVGSTLLVLAPVSSSLSYTVMTDAQWVLTSNNAYYDVQGTEMVNTLCPVVTDPATRIQGTQVRCIQYSRVFQLNFPGFAKVQVRGPTPQAVRRETAIAFTGIGRQMPIEVWPNGAIETGKPSWARTAPLWGGVAGLFAMLLVPKMSRRRPAENPA